MSAKRLTHEERAKIYRLWKEEGLTYRTIAERCGVNPATVGNVVKKMNGTSRKSQINEEFDNAVNQMIEEVDKPAEIEQVAEPVVMTEEHTVETVPDAVMTAVNERINTLSETLSDNLLTIKKMQQENENLRSELAVLYQWKTDNENEG